MRDPRDLRAGDGGEGGNEADAGDEADGGWDWQRPKGIFVLIPIEHEAGARIRAIRERYDPRLARMNAPHLSLAGSSGVGPIDPNTPRDDLARILGGVAAATTPFTVAAEPPHRFVDTDIVSFPLPARGPLRALHDRVATSGLRFLPTRFAFAPHATISYYPELTRPRERELLALRLGAPIRIEALEVFLTNDPQPPDLLFRVPLGGGPGTPAPSSPSP